MPTPFSRLLGVACLALGLAATAFAQTAALPQLALKRGVNAIGYDPLWSDPAKARFQTRHMQAIRDGGFDHVRLNLHAFEHMDAEGRLSSDWLKTLDEMTAAALNAGLQVILDQHNFNDCAKAVSYTHLAARTARSIVEQVIAGGLGQAFLLNVNIPNRADADRLPRKITRLGRRHSAEAIIEQINPRGETIYWIGPAGDARDAGEGTDFHATANGQVSITPLQVDLTEHASLGAWAQRLGL